MLKKNTKFGALKSLALAGFVGACSVGVSQGAITVTIDEFTATTFTVSFTGTLETSTDTPQHDGVFTLAPTAGSGDLSYQFYTGTPVKLSGDITLNGTAFAIQQMANNGGTTGDSFFFYSNSNVAPGAADIFGGTITFSGAFDVSAATTGFTLYQGYELGGQSVTNAVIQSSAVPEPSGLMLASVGGLTLVARRRRKA